MINNKLINWLAMSGQTLWVILNVDDEGEIGQAVRLP